MKPPKPLKNSHTANTKYGMGDFYGSGVRNPVGRVREGFGMDTITKKKLKTPPRGLA